MFSSPHEICTARTRECNVTARKKGMCGVQDSTRSTQVKPMSPTKGALVEFRGGEVGGTRPLLHSVSFYYAYHNHRKLSDSTTLSADNNTRPADTKVTSGRSVLTKFSFEEWDEPWWSAWYTSTSPMRGLATVSMSVAAESSEISVCCGRQRATRRAVPIHLLGSSAGCLLCPQFRTVQRQWNEANRHKRR